MNNYPSLPDLKDIPAGLNWLTNGCYFVNIILSADNGLAESCIGTLRADIQGDKVLLSGDLYADDQQNNYASTELPVFPVKNYRYYIRMTDLLEDASGNIDFVMKFEIWRYEEIISILNPGWKWELKGSYTASMVRGSDGAPYSPGSNGFSGQITDNNDNIAGRIILLRNSDFFRKAIVEIKHVEQSKIPLDNGRDPNNNNNKYADWPLIGKSINWNLEKDVSINSIPDQPGRWPLYRLHEQLVNNTGIDKEWRYHLLVVPHLPDGYLGVMFDHKGIDINKVPREGFAISTEVKLPDRDQYEPVKGLDFHTAKDPYFRTAVHELGHAMGIYHNYSDNKYMNITDNIAESAYSSGNTLSEHIDWDFNEEDKKRLNHLPDLFVRPGGIPFDPDFDPGDVRVINNLVLEVNPVLEEVPLGAPVRINMKLENTGDKSIMTLKSLSMNTGLVRGHVIQVEDEKRRPIRDCVIRKFSPLVHFESNLPLAELGKNHSLRHSLTLLRGGSGALFPKPGKYKIVVELHWPANDEINILWGGTFVRVLPVTTMSDKKLAEELLMESEVLISHVTAFPLKNGINSISKALDNPTLRPHYKFIAAKRMMHEDFNLELDKAASLIDDETVMSPAEIRRTALILKKVKTPHPGKDKIAQELKRRVDNLSGWDEVTNAVREIN